MRQRDRKRLERARETEKILVGVQLVTDAAVIAAAEVFGMGPKRCERFAAALGRCVNEMSALINADSREDPAFVYTKERIDRRLRAICGEENFQPWEERYGQRRGGV